MLKAFYKLLCIFVAVFVMACGNNSNDILLHHMDYIRQDGDSDALQALTELTSIEDDIRSSPSEYVRNKYLLLKTRLEDKANLVPASPDTIEEVVRYFDRHGNMEERMEAYYYQGSVYRDLRDYPRSATSFREVLSIAQWNDAEDSRLLQNAYSQLSWLYSKQQIYAEAVKMAKAGCSMAERTGTVDPIYLMDVASASIHYGDTAEAIRYCDKCMAWLRRDTTCSYPDVVCEMLIRYSEKGMKQEAEECMAYLSNSQWSAHAHNYLPALACYLEHFVSSDSSILVHKMILSESNNFSQKMASAKRLMLNSFGKGNYKECGEHAVLFNDYVDSVFTENQYEQTSRACGEHLYAISLKKEMLAREEASSNQGRFYVLLAVFLLSALVVSIVYGQRKRYYVRKILSKENALYSAKQAIARYDVQLKENEALIGEQRSRLASGENELKVLKDKVETLNRSIVENESLLHDKQKQIAELVRLSLLDKATCEYGDVVQKFRSSSVGKKHLTDADWQDLYVAVETMCPGFSEAVLTMPRSSDLSKKTAYLLKIGMSNPQIANLTNCSRQTVFDRVKKIRERLGDVLG